MSLASDRGFGVLFGSTVPAAFWTGMLELIGRLLGQPPSGQLLAMVGAGIAGYLAITLRLVLSPR